MANWACVYIILLMSVFQIFWVKQFIANTAFMNKNRVLLSVAMVISCVILAVALRLAIKSMVDFFFNRGPDVSNNGNDIDIDNMAKSNIVSKDGKNEEIKLEMKTIV